MASNSRTATILRIAVQNGGQVCVDDVRRAGIAPRTLRALTHSGTLVRLRRGLYVLPSGGVPSPHDHLRILARHCNLVISHCSAASWFGFRPGTRWSAPEIGHFTCVGAIHLRLGPDVVVHRTKALGKPDVVSRAGVHITSPARTLVDLAAIKPQVSDEILVDLFDHFVSMRQLSASQMRRYLDQASRLRGLPRASQVLGPMLDGTLVESTAERRLLRLLVAHRLPTPRTQFNLHDDHGRFVARLDVAWPEEKLAIEVDGFRYHSSVRAFNRDRERGNQILAEGWMLYRTTPADIAAGAGTLMNDLSRRLSHSRAIVKPRL